MKHWRLRWRAMLGRLPRSKQSSQPIVRPMPSSILRTLRAISKRPISLYGNGREIFRQRRSAEPDRRLCVSFPLQHREKTGDGRAVFHPKKRIVHKSNSQAGGGGGFAHMLGVMFIAARVRQMKGITIAAFHAQC